MTSRRQDWRLKHPLLHADYDNQMYYNLGLVGFYTGRFVFLVGNMDDALMILSLDGDANYHTKRDNESSGHTKVELLLSL